MVKKLLCCIALLLTSCSYTSERIILYTFYTPSHEELLNEWFLPSLQDDFEVVIKRFEQECPSGTYMQKGWICTMLRKINMILDAINQHWGDIILYADVDIQFFAPIAPHILKALQSADLAIQKDNPEGKVCAGLFALRANEKTRTLFERVKKRMQLHKKESDNPALDSLLRGPYCNVAWQYLPVSFFSTGALSYKTFSKTNCWQEGDTVIIPDTLIAHHANYTKGVKNKIKLLAYVKSLVIERTRQQ